MGKRLIAPKMQASSIHHDPLKHDCVNDHDYYCDYDRHVIHDGDRHDDRDVYDDAGQRVNDSDRYQLQMEMISVVGYV